MKWIATPKTKRDTYPNRPMDNREKRALWAVKYYAQYKPNTHPPKQKR